MSHFLVMETPKAHSNNNNNKNNNNYSHNQQHNMPTMGGMNRAHSGGKPNKPPNNTSHQQHQHQMGMNQQSYNNNNNNNKPNQPSYPSMQTQSTIVTQRDIQKKQKPMGYNNASNNMNGNSHNQPSPQLKQSKPINVYYVVNDIPPFTSHMSIEEASRLKIHDQIDHRDEVGRFVSATVLQKQGTNLKIHYDGWNRKWDTWSDFALEMHRFAHPGSISKRQSHRFRQLKKGDYVDINPIQRHPGWKCGEIRSLDKKSGQVQVVYESADTQFLYWAHLDNVNEIAEFLSKPYTIPNNNRYNSVSNVSGFGMNNSVNNNNPFSNNYTQNNNQNNYNYNFHQNNQNNTQNNNAFNRQNNNNIQQMATCDNTNANNNNIIIENHFHIHF